MMEWLPLTGECLLSEKLDDVAIEGGALKVYTQRVAVCSTAKGRWVSLRGQSYFIPYQDDVTVAATETSGTITAPLTGKVIEVAVSEGDKINGGDLILIIEAMKMEYRLTAPSNGTVASLHCHVDELVEQGATVAQIILSDDTTTDSLL